MGSGERGSSRDAQGQGQIIAGASTARNYFTSFLTAASIALTPPASAALDLIAGTRTGIGVDFPARLAVGVTLGRATTILACSGSSPKIRSDSPVAIPISTRTSATTP